MSNHTGDAAAVKHLSKSRQDAKEIWNGPTTRAWVKTKKAGGKAWERFDELATKVVAREITFEVFVKETKAEFRVMALAATRRRRPPYWFELEDIITLLVSHFWYYAFVHVGRDGQVGFVPGKGTTEGEYLRWNIMQRVQKDLGRARGENMHTQRMFGPSPEVVTSTGDFSQVQVWKDHGTEGESFEIEFDEHRRCDALERLTRAAREFVVQNEVEKQLSQTRNRKTRQGEIREFILGSHPKDVRESLKTLGFRKGDELEVVENMSELIARGMMTGAASSSEPASCEESELTRGAHRRGRVSCLGKVVMSIVGATRIDRVWEGKLRENYASITNDFALGKTKEEVVRGLEQHFEKNTPKDKLANCNICGGHSDESLPACPYCEDQGPEELGAPVPAESGVVATAKASAPESEALPGTEIDASKMEAETLEQPKKKGGRKSAQEKMNAQMEVAEKKKVKAPKASPKPSTPVLDIAEAKPVVTEADLDRELMNYREAGRRNAASFWHMGVAISKIHLGLWEQRRDGEKRKYKSWNQFVEAELKIAVQHANRLRNVADHFTEESAAKYGATILMVIDRAPKEEHSRLMEKVDNGDASSVSALAKEVKEIREAKGITVLDSEENKKKSETKTNAMPSKAAREKAAAKRLEKKASITFGLKSETGMSDPLMVRPDGPQSDPVPFICPPELRETLGKCYASMFKSINGITMHQACVVNDDGTVQFRWTGTREAEDD
jgi:hypothetical protein